MKNLIQNEEKEIKQRNISLQQAINKTENENMNLKESNKSLQVLFIIYFKGYI